MCLIQKSLKQYQYIVIVLITIINKIQEYCIHFFIINYQIFYPKVLYFKKKFDSEFLNIRVWLTNQGSKPLEIEYKVNITSAIN